MNSYSCKLSEITFSNKKQYILGILSIFRSFISNSILAASLTREFHSLTLPKRIVQSHPCFHYSWDVITNLGLNTDKDDSEDKMYTFHSSERIVWRRLFSSIFWITWFEWFTWIWEKLWTISLSAIWGQTDLLFEEALTTFK